MQEEEAPASDAGRGAVVFCVHVNCGLTHGEEGEEGRLDSGRMTSSPPKPRCPLLVLGISRVVFGQRHPPTHLRRSGDASGKHIPTLDILLPRPSSLHRGICAIQKKESALAPLVSFRPPPRRLAHGRHGVAANGQPGLGDIGMTLIIQAHRHAYSSPPSSPPILPFHPLAPCQTSLT